jgi:hypothetical protein
MYDAVQAINLHKHLLSGDVNITVGPDIQLLGIILSACKFRQPACRLGQQRRRKQ